MMCLGIVHRRALFFAACVLACAALVSCSPTSDASDPAPSSASVSVIDVTQEPGYSAESIVISPETDFACALAAGEIDSVLVIGDSISAGRGTDGFVNPVSGTYLFSDGEGDYFEPDPTNGSWVNQLRAYCAAAGVSGFLNASISGSSYSWLLETFDDWVGEGADAIVVMLGTNDASIYGAEEVRALCEEALARLSARCKYLLVIAPPNNDRNDMAVVVDTATLDTVIYEVCVSHGYEFVSAYWALEPYTSDYNDDQVHPTTEGNRKLWEYVADKIGLG